ncbi:flagellar hook-associated protein FlgK [Rhodoplanes sp. Z2-YC6860]|uniref:flagellar hook-associated protein FlgK n=1 Tax=Rhodoplanes sp. Z2-YC6860 TaxID=674703 RepID=UPI00078D80D2|nr:flagellar hook-associated protein FlgK [Rhodoplanes sp. Z2-YC6860]AMN39093.1 flagellar hook-associated protein FlgK [Rhodoplanes sp. Z2-YC6860]
MSINSAAYIALSGMMATQVQMSVASANISNAGTTGYTEKTAQQEAVVNGGVAAGTTITGISSSVDAFLLKSLIASGSDTGAAKTADNYLDQLQSLYGTTGSSDSSGTSLGNTIASFEAALSSLESSPNSASLKENAVGALDQVVSQLRETSAGIQQLRGNADRDIAKTVSDVNQQLELIGTLNTQIQQASAAGQSTADLVDQRNTALQAVASEMSVSYYTTSSGALQVYSKSGQALVDSSVHELSYTPASTVTSSTTYSATPPSGFSGITVNGIDITSQLGSGSLAELVTLRDTTLPDAQTQLDSLASQLASTLNAVSSQGTALPPPSTLTGSAEVTAGTALSATGTVRFAVADQSGNLVSYQDLDLSSYSTVGDLVSAINGISGLSASIDSNGHVVISSTDSSDGVAINEMSSSVGSSGEGLVQWLGLNDLVTGTSASDIAVRPDILDNSSLLGTSILDSSASPQTGAQVLSPGSSTIADDLYSAMIGDTKFSAVPGIGATTSSFADYAAAIVSSVATQASQATTTYNNKQALQSSLSSTMSSESGVNLDEETARLSTLQNQYSASAELLQVLNQMFSTLLTAVQSAVA